MAVPADDPIFIQETIGSLLERHVGEHPDRDFIVYPDRDLRWSYAQFNDRVDQLAKGLLAIGFEKGDHLGIWARNVPDWITFMFATAKIGVWLVTVNPVYKSHELAYVIKQSDIKALAIIDSFRDVDYVQIVRDLVPESLKQERGRLDAPEFPELKSLIYMGPEKHRGFYSMPELLLLGEHGDDEKLRATLASLDCHDVDQHAVHVGHDGLPEGRHAHAPQHRQQRTVSSATDRISPPPTASACRCRSSTASAASWGCSARSRTDRRSSWWKASTRCSFSARSTRSGRPRSTACRRCSSPSWTIRCSTCSTSRRSEPASWRAPRVRSRR